MKLLAISDIHGRVNSLKRVLNSVSNINYILLAGDLAFMPGYSSSEVLKILSDWCVKSGCKAYVVPGNTDSKSILYVNYPSVEVIHLSISFINPFTVGGIGGGMGFGFWEYSKLSDELMSKFVNEFLMKCGAALIPYEWVLLTHTPPYGVRTDVLYTGEHIGSKALRKLVELRKPALVINGHIHEARGIDYLGRTMIVNPGPCYKGYYAVIRVEDKGFWAELKKA